MLLFSEIKNGNAIINWPASWFHDDNQQLWVEVSILLCWDVTNACMDRLLSMV
jgi:hypothetical protein